MRRFLLISLIFLTVFLAGCESRVLVNLDLPIIVEPAPPYRAEVDGYISYDYWTRHVKLTGSYNRYDRYYEPLQNAKITVAETGKSTRTDKNGYFFLRGVPYGKITLIVEHRLIRERVLLTTRSY